MELRIKIYLQETTSSLPIGTIQPVGFYNELSDTLEQNDLKELALLGLRKEEVRKYLPQSNHDDLKDRGYSLEDNPGLFETYRLVDLQASISFHKELKQKLESHSGSLNYFYDDQLKKEGIDLLDQLINIFEMASKNNYRVVYTAYAS